MHTGTWGLVVLAVALLACRAGEDDELARKEEELRAREQKLEQEKAKLAAAPAPQAAPQPVPATTPAGEPAPQNAPRMPLSATVRDVAAVVTLSISMTKPSGEPWDVGGGAPDPMIIAGGETGNATATFKDTLNPTARLTLQLRPGTTVSFAVFDQDAVANDPISNFTAKYSGPGSSAKGKNGAASYTVKFE